MMFKCHKGFVNKQIATIPKQRQYKNWLFFIYFDTIRLLQIKIKMETYSEREWKREGEKESQ